MNQIIILGLILGLLLPEIAKWLSRSRVSGRWFLLLEDPFHQIEQPLTKRIRIWNIPFWGLKVTVEDDGGSDSWSIRGVCCDFRKPLTATSNSKSESGPPEVGETVIFGRFFVSRNGASRIGNFSLSAPKGMRIFRGSSSPMDPSIDTTMRLDETTNEYQARIHGGVEPRFPHEWIVLRSDEGPEYRQARRDLVALMRLRREE